MTHFIDFHIGGWHVGSINSASGVFVGQNLQYGWRDTAKQNQASRNITGDYNLIHDTSNTVSDPDCLDTWIQKSPPFASVAPPSPALARLWAQRRKKYRRASCQKETLDWDW